MGGLNRLGIADEVAAKSKVMLGPGGDGISASATEGAVSTYTRLEKGDLDIGIMLLSDILPNKEKYDVVGVLPQKVTTPTAIVGFIATKASDPAGAKALLQYLASPDAQAIFKQDGYGPHS